MVNSQESKKSVPARYDKIIYEPYSFTDKRTRKTVYRKVTPAREVVRRLTCDLVVELFIQDRQRTQAKTPKGRSYGIMAWNDKQKYAAMRLVAELCYGPLESVHAKILKWYWMGQLSDTSVLTDFQVKGIQSAFLIVVASEMQPGKSLAADKDDTAVKPYAMIEEADWYCQGLEAELDRVDVALAQIETKANRYDDKETRPSFVAFKLWANEVRGPELKQIKREFWSSREAEVDAQVDAKESSESTESTADEPESEIAEALVKELTPLLIEAANKPPN
ncbi:MAG: hypothetical protein H6797_02080 [Candidatus Nomurabacteria bacterium]|nr:MAG: hypothetical protein H6797_02080 [Candidatus Nomurabacteria bacterium]